METESLESMICSIYSFGTECASEPETTEWTCGDPVNYHGYDYATVRLETSAGLLRTSVADTTKMATPFLGG